MMLLLGSKVESIMDSKIRGHVVGYGGIQWPSTSPDFCGDEQTYPVYLVQLEGLPASSSLGVACRVLRGDRVKEI